MYGSEKYKNIDFLESTKSRSVGIVHLKKIYIWIAITDLGP